MQGGDSYFFWSSPRLLASSRRGLAGAPLHLGLDAAGLNLAATCPIIRPLHGRTTHTYTWLEYSGRGRARRRKDQGGTCGL